MPTPTYIMKTINVSFTGANGNEQPVFDDYVLGEEGENRSAKMVITLPTAWADFEDTTPVSNLAICYLNSKKKGGRSANIPMTSGATYEYEIPTDALYAPETVFWFAVYSTTEDLETRLTKSLIVKGTVNTGYDVGTVTAPFGNDIIQQLIDRIELVENSVADISQRLDELETDLTSAHILPDDADLNDILYSDYDYGIYVIKSATSTSTKHYPTVGGEYDNKTVFIEYGKIGLQSFQRVSASSYTGIRKWIREYVIGLGWGAWSAYGINGESITGLELNSAGNLLLSSGYVIPQQATLDAKIPKDFTSESSASTISDTDIFPMNNVPFTAVKKTAWSLFKSTLKTYFDTLYPAKNSTITGATKTKITYDDKGLVTIGEDATTADISDSADKRYVTDAEKTVIGNTSGTNTGDQDLSGYVTTASIVNDLTTGGITVPLSAEQGKYLQTAKMSENITGKTNASSISDTDVFPLNDVPFTAIKKIAWSLIKSTLKTYFDTLYGTVITVINDLTTGGTTDALSAEMGKTLEGDKLSKTKKPLQLWNGTDAYTTGDLVYVYDSGELAPYVAVVNSTNENPVNNPTKWILISIDNALFAKWDLDGGLLTNKLTMSPNLTSIDDNGIADNEVAIFDLTNKSIKTSNVLIGDLSKDTPIASVTITDNTSITVTAVDLADNKFTCVGHGLLDNQIIYPILNNNNELNYSLAQFSTGLVNNQRYWVIKVDNDNFRVSASTGPGGAVDITGAGDITKWHFERINTVNLVISSLPAKERYKIIINGRRLGLSATFLQFLVNSMSVSSNEFLSSANATGYTAAAIAFTNADMGIFAEVDFDYHNFLTVSYRTIMLFSASSTTKGQQVYTNIMMSHLSKQSTITSLTLANHALANGSTVEVYNA